MQRRITEQLAFTIPKMLTDFEKQEVLGNKHL